MDENKRWFLRFCPCRRKHFDISITQGAASLCPGLGAGCPLRGAQTASLHAYLAPSQTVFFQATNDLSSYHFEVLIGYY